MTNLNAPVVRRAAQVAVLTAALLAAAGASPAVAAPPQQWEQPEPVSALYALLLLVFAPLALFAAITVLAYLSTTARGEGYTPGLAWRNPSEWFGGPHGGVGVVDTDGDREAIEPAESAESQDLRGGASAHW